METSSVLSPCNIKRPWDAMTDIHLNQWLPITLADLKI